MQILKQANKIIRALVALALLAISPGCGAPMDGSDVPYSCKPETPVLEQVIPNKVPHGQPDLLMIINGSRFNRSSVVFAGDKTQTILKTTFITDKQLTAWLPFDQMAKPGQVAISVTNPPGTDAYCQGYGLIANSNFLYVEVQ